MAQIINKQIISIQQDSNGRLYNLVRLEDEYGYYTFQQELVKNEKVEQAIKPLIDFRQFGGHMWFINSQTKTVSANPCSLPTNCKVCKPCNNKQ